MKPNHLFTSLLAVTALLVASCSTPKMAQNSAVPDDVYNTTAKAKEYKPSTPVQTTTSTNVITDDYYANSDSRYDMDYSSRIDRFYYGSPYRNYYDPYYNYYGYNTYGYNSYYNPNPYSYSFNGYYGNFYNNYYSPYSYWSYYGSPYYGNYWGLYSFNSPYYGNIGYYGGGYYGGGYYGGGFVDPNYGARPRRGGENGVDSRANGTGYNGSAPGAPSRGNTNGDRSGLIGTRAGSYNPSNGTTTQGTTRSGSTTSDARPTRSTSSDARPTRTSEAPSRPAPTYNPPPQSSSPPPSRAEGSGSSSSSGSSRPTRGGK